MICQRDIRSGRSNYREGKNNLRPEGEASGSFHFHFEEDSSARILPFGANVPTCGEVGCTEGWSPVLVPGRNASSKTDAKFGGGTGSCLN